MFRTKKTAAITAIAAIGGLTLAGCSSNTGGGAEPAEVDPDEQITLTMAFWGNDVRADLYNQAFDAFNEEYPNIQIQSSFLDFPAFWELRQTEAAGGGLPDVMQFDYSYLRQYAENGLLLDLTPYVGSIIDDEPLSDEILSIGQVADGMFGIPTSTNAWAMFLNPTTIEEIGVAPFAGGSWEDYAAWMKDAADTAAANGVDAFGGSDFTGRIQNFEVQQRAKGQDLFTEDGEPNFTEDDLREFWEQGSEVRTDGSVMPMQRNEELHPLGGFDIGAVASELTWDNFGAGYLANLGEGYDTLDLVAPPVTVEGATDLYLKPSMLHAIAANSDHPDAAATLVDFLINSPESGEIFGTNRGLPASATALEAATLDDFSQKIADYEASIEDRIGAAPPVPIVGYGTLEEKFRQLGEELGYGTTTVDAAVSQFFSEMNVILN
ncbi:ABC transporter substrate-binding protein [Microbacterium amylolyticum]|uniref:Multiple sugar transport system substrate-binding protein n=1 Tax=Microbacterium amylolyticum TaxID=936337 RepID=A0ABS4ZIB8_9MICO|nr:extracellular solute-binding protein [Microbacterium amylolyticum]MBP2437023.1 multiple sugar transport system substrate-binding protein [Microbacterium amylolyticum]